MTFPRFAGNCPKNVSKDAKYSIRTGSAAQGYDGPIVAVIYESEDGERWHAATDNHPDLVNMVNEVKTSVGNPPNGAFYINEYKQVIVPVVGSSDYFLAGAYELPLRFEFEGKVISGEAVDLEGNPISPGDTWTGPHVGIRYKLCAGGSDIEYSMSPRPNVEKRVKLSQAISPERAEKVASGIMAVKGPRGGRFYVNEYLNVFAPLEDGRDTPYLYCGRINLDEWFPKPHDHQADIDINVLP